MKQQFTTLATCSNLHGSTVLLRADLNVPLDEQGHIRDAYRLEALVPTLTALQKHACRIIITTHMGRPMHADPTLSTRHLIPWFERHGYVITYAPSPTHARDLLATTAPRTLIMLENLRFFPGEQAQDPTFARELAQLAQLFVQDAFAVLHHAAASITLVPRLFEPADRCIGMLVERELTHLQPLVDRPQSPFVVVLGGAKIATKLPLLTHLIEHMHPGDSILICPALAFSFLAAQGIPVGKSLVDPTVLPQLHDLMHRAHERGVDLMLPKDFQAGAGGFGGTLTTTTTLASDMVGTSLGPLSTQAFCGKIAQAKTVFLNGAPGDAAYPATLVGAQALLAAMAASSAYTVIGGGDTVGIARAAGYAAQMNFVSTGGGATLAYLAGSSLPGLVAMKS